MAINTFSKSQLLPCLGFPHLWTRQFKPTQKGWMPILAILNTFRFVDSSHSGRYCKWQATLHLAIWILFLVSSDRYCSPEWDSNLGPKQPLATWICNTRVLDHSATIHRFFTGYLGHFGSFLDILEVFSKFLGHFWEISVSNQAKTKNKYFHQLWGAQALDSWSKYTTHIYTRTGLVSPILQNNWHYLQNFLRHK